MKGLQKFTKLMQKDFSNILDNFPKKQIDKLKDIDKKIDQKISNIPYELDSFIYHEDKAKLKINEKKNNDKKDKDDDDNNDDFNGGMKIPILPIAAKFKKHKEEAE